MAYSQAFIDFLAIYEERLNVVIDKINSLCTIEAFNANFDQFSSLSKEQWYQFIEDWIRLRSKLKHPQDIDFFEYSIIPVSEKQFEYFVDLDDPGLLVFGYGYYTIKNKCWYKYIMFANLTEVVDNSPELIDFAELKSFLEQLDKKEYAQCHEQAGA